VKIPDISKETRWKKKFSLLKMMKILTSF
jgi:hypothetical protein